MQPTPSSPRPRHPVAPVSTEVLCAGCWLWPGAGENLPALLITASRFAGSRAAAAQPRSDFTVLASHGNAEDLLSVRTAYETLAHTMQVGGHTMHAAPRQIRYTDTACIRQGYPTRDTTPDSHCYVQRALSRTVNW